MTDRELLERAARAAGLQLWTHADGGLYLSDPMRRWNPLENDGDEARLEAHLSLKVEWYPALVLIGPQDGVMYAAYFDDHGGDKQKARRWAGTRAAAAIGEKGK